VLFWTVCFNEEIKNNQSSSKEKRQLLIFYTPRVIRLFQDIFHLPSWQPNLLRRSSSPFVVASWQSCIIVAMRHTAAPHVARHLSPLFLF